MCYVDIDRFHNFVYNLILLLGFGDILGLIVFYYCTYRLICKVFVYADVISH